MGRYLIPLLVLVAVASVASADNTVTLNYSDFSSTTGLTLVGQTYSTANRLRLTDSSGGHTGGVWATQKQAVGQGFDTTFQFNIHNLGQNGFQNESGGDGIAFVLQNESLSALAVSGSMGYGIGPYGGSGITKSVAIEFDTYENTPEYYGDDPDNNHISIHTRGTLPNSTLEAYSIGCTSGLAINMSDTNTHTARILYDPGTISVFLDNLTTPVLTASLDLQALGVTDAGNMWVGFTASTGSAWEAHDIVDWSYSEVPEPATLSLLALGALALLRRRR